MPGERATLHKSLLSHTRWRHQISDLALLNPLSARNRNSPSYLGEGDTQVGFKTVQISGVIIDTLLGRMLVVGISRKLEV